MRDTLLNYIDRFRHDRHERVVLGSVLLVLAMVVTLVVWWQLRYTGITMTNETFCGYEEHTHTDECYEYYLVCGLEESEGHIHDESCYDEEGNLVCGLEETEGHTHDESCYEYTLVCGLEEHTHTVECLIDLNADVEDYEIWEATLPLLSGDLRTDIVNIAWSQLDYKESTANFSLGEDGETRYGYTRYGAWYGNEYGTWDAMFAAFCLYYAGIDESEFPLNSGAYAWAVQLKGAGAYAEASEAIPSMGDLVFFDSDGDGRIDRVGIVTAVDESASMVTIIEGDYTVEGVDTVAEHIYPFSNTTIVGYGLLPTDEDTDTETDTDEAEEVSDETEDTEDTEDTEETEETEDTETEGDAEEDEEEESLWFTDTSDSLCFTASDGGVTVSVIAPEGSLPDNATLAVTLLDEDSSEYAEAAEAVGYEDSEDTGMAALDITFYDEYGTEIEPTDTVTVSVDITEIIPEGSATDVVQVTHLAEVDDTLVATTVETLAETVTDDTSETATVVFATEGFSTFTIQWGSSSSNTTTVYVYDTDGNEIDATIESSTLTFTSGTTVNESDLTDNVTVSNDYTYSYMYVTYTTSQGSGGGGPGGGGPGSGGTTTRTVSNVTSIYYDGSTYTITYTTTGGGGMGGGSQTQTQTVTASSITGIYLYYEAPETIYVYYDRVTINGTTLTAQNDTYGIASVTLDGDDVTHASGSARGSTLSGGLEIIDPYSDSTRTVSITVTPESGYYVTMISVNCVAGDNSNATSCSTYQDGGAYTASFTVSTSGEVTVTVTLNATNGFHHSSEAENYFILIAVSTIPSPLYVEYDYGDIVTYIGSGNSSAFSTAYGWTTTDTATNYYGTDADDSNGDGDPGVKTSYTQYKYAYESGNESEAANWTHYANTITEEAKAQALAAGYVFAGWYAEYYTSVEVSESTGTYNNWDYTFTNSYGTNYYDENEQVALTTNVKLTAQWVPIGVTVEKTVSGLSGTEFASTGRTYTLQLQVQGTDESGAVTWTNYGDAIELTVTGDGSASTTFYPLPEGTYRVVETGGNSNLTSSDNSTIYYVTVSADGTVTVSSTDDDDYTETTVGSTTVLLAGSLSVTNTYTDELQTVDVTLTKVDNSGSTLSGAVFTLTDSSGNETTYSDVGTATIEDLVIGSSYTLTETTAPNGYSLLESPITFTVTSTSGITLTSGSDDATVTVDGTTGAITIEVKNKASPEMPSTGGRGTKLYTMVGLLLICGAGYLLYRKQNRKCKWRWNI